MRGDTGLRLWIHHHEVGVESWGDRALALLQPDQPRRSFAHPARRQPHVAHVLGEVQAADVERLHAGTSRGCVFKRLRLLFVGVRSVVRADHADHPSFEAVEQRVPVGRAADRGQHLHCRADTLEVIGGQE